MGEKVKKSKTVPSSVCHVHKSKNFTLLSNSFLRSSNLSLASVGLMGRVMGLPILPSKSASFRAFRCPLPYTVLLWAAV